MSSSSSSSSAAALERWAADKRDQGYFQHPQADAPTKGLQQPSKADAHKAKPWGKTS
jgi:hypothetical protein